MTRLTYILPLSVGVLALTGCPDDNTPGTDTEGATGASTGGNTMPPTTTMTAAGTADETGDPPDPDTTDGGSACDPPCLPGQECIAGQCFGDPEATGPLCEMWGENGNYNDCITMPGTCEGASCVSASEEAGACALLGCTDVCDCPDPGDLGGTLVCDLLTADEQNGCFFSCEGGDPCPAGMTCQGNFFCAWGGDPGGEPYGACLNEDGTVNPCQEGLCGVFGDPPVGGACASPCMENADCPAPPEGGANPVCGNFSGGMMFCILPCTGGCPDGMECAGNTLCVWPPEQVAVPGFGDCVDPVPNVECNAEETCFTDDAGDPTHGFCSEAGCATADDCPTAPATGDAPVTCGDLGAGNTCYLDCAAGQTCPDTMECINDDYCAYPALGTLLNEDFEGGAIPGTWTLIDNDGLVQDAMSAIVVDDAFVVATDAEGSMAAVGNSWYDPPAQADDWLITPSVTPSATSVFAFEARSLDPNVMFQEDFEVRVSTTDTAIASFTDTVLTVTMAPSTYTSHEVDLSAYDGQPIFIAIRLMSNDGNLLFVDNVFVTE